MGKKSKSKRIASINATDPSTMLYDALAERGLATMIDRVKFKPASGRTVITFLDTIDVHTFVMALSDLVKRDVPTNPDDIFYRVSCTKCGPVMVTPNLEEARQFVDSPMPSMPEGLKRLMETMGVDFKLFALDVETGQVADADTFATEHQYVVERACAWERV